MAFETEKIRHTLSTILHTQGEAIAAEVLDISRVETSFVEHDFNQDIYSLDLRIPTVRFAQLEKDIEKIARKIQDKLGKLGLDRDGEYIGIVRIYPELSVGPGAITVPVPTQTDEKRIWKPGRIRLFLSHISRIKGPTSELKKALVPFGVDAFVAHEDIQPTQLWHREIEFALRSMDILCALITDDFIKSQWTDQEVGFALGRGIPVIAVSCGADPYGLLGKHQALRADATKLAASATRIVDIIAAQDHLKSRLTEGLVEALASAISFQDAKVGMKRISDLQSHLSDAQIRKLLDAARDNSQVRDAHGVVSQIQNIAVKRKVISPTPQQVTAKDFDDDIPF
ncbi:MAG: toll/interleukin-1 receptor domain-containing protein [Gammaproteobacteria bacterium]|nr:MAG: toll/interleukin-1 receptor domain-containing protein [Gammaproteobacteria bacterium]